MHVDASPRLDRASAEKGLSEPFQFFRVDSDMISLKIRDNHVVLSLLTGFCHVLESWKVAQCIANRSSTESQFHAIQEFLVLLCSAKNNFDPTDAWSEVAALFKIVLMMQKQTAPEKADFTHLNPKFDLSGQDQVAISMHSKEWEITERVAVLESYGASGGNDAPVFKEAIPEVPGSIPTSPIFLSDCPIIISGESTEAVRYYCDVLGTSLSRKSTTSDLADVAYNLAIRQNRGFQYSLTFITCSIEQLQSDLKRAIFEAMALNQPRSQEPYVVLCFGGQEGHTAYLSKVLYDNSLLLQRHLVSCSTPFPIRLVILLSMRHLISGVRRVEQRAKGSVTWLEAGSGSAIIPMIERAVFETHERNVYIATPLRYDANAQLNLAKATSRLWSCGVGTQFWPFHSSQCASYNRYNLLSY
jgi:hypothetical protein